MKYRSEMSDKNTQNNIGRDGGSGIKKINSS